MSAAPATPASPIPSPISAAMATFTQPRTFIPPVTTSAAPGGFVPPVGGFSGSDSPVGAFAVGAFAGAVGAASSAVGGAGCFVGGVEGGRSVGDDVCLGDRGARNLGDIGRDNEADERMDIDWKYGDAKYIEVDWWERDMEVDIFPLQWYFPLVLIEEKIIEIT
ncbi:hypothetical protein INT45_004858 [Circinella minor]|uniref:Uncharacterized protein n=1 Tax=Circinella minor TaxID=1195481 RepID=A0A8H7VHZ7_9FUNG|nr:hypothetical protein INT45_004858 [Circinella minor]